MNIKIHLNRNNPEKLLNLFHTLTSEKEKNKVVKRLISLKASDELERLIDTTFHQEVINSLIIFNEKNCPMLVELYDRTTLIEVKKTIVDKLQESKAFTELEKLLDSEFKNQISTYLVSNYKNNPVKLLEIFNKGVPQSRPAIVKHLLDLKAAPELCKLLDTPFKKEIIPRLIIIYRKNHKKLLMLFKLADDVKDQNQIMDHLLSQKAEKELIELINTPYKKRVIKTLVEIAKQNDEKLLKYFFNEDFKDVRRNILTNIAATNNQELLWHLFDQAFENCEKNMIAQYILKLNEENPEKMAKLFFKLDFFDLKKSIVLNLIRFEAYEELWKLVNSEFKDQILPNLIQAARKDPGKQYKMFFKTKDSELRKDIVNNLIHLDADNELRKLISSEMIEPISRYFFYKYKNQPFMLENIFISCSLHTKENIIDRLIALNAVDQLKRLLNNCEGQSKEKIIKFMADNFNSDSDFLINLFHKSHDADQKKAIILYLIEQKAQKELESLLDTEYKNMVMPYLINKKVPDSVILQFSPLEIFINLIYRQKNDFYDFIILNEPLLQFVFIEKMLAIYFFELLRDKERLYLLLYHFGLDEFSGHKFNASKLETKFIEPYYKMCSDANTLSLPEAKYFNRVFKQALKANSKRLYILAYLLNKEQFELQVSIIRKNYIIIASQEEQEKEEAKIKIRFADKLQNAQTKDEINTLLRSRDAEISKIISMSQFKKIDDVLKYRAKMPYFSLPVFKNIIKLPYRGTKKGLNEILKCKQIVEDYVLYEEQCKTSLKNALTDLNNAGEILNLKQIYQQKLNSVISKNDFIYSFKKLGKKYSKDEKLLNYLQDILIDCEDLEVKLAAFEYYFKFNMMYWFRLIMCLITNKNIGDLRYYIVFKISDLYNRKCFKLLLELFDWRSEPKIANLKLFAGVPKEKTDDQLIEKTGNKIMVWDYRFIYLISLLNQMVYLKIKPESRKEINKKHLLDSLPEFSDKFKSKIESLLLYCFKD